MTLVRFCKTPLVLGGFNTYEHESEEKEEWTMEILFMKKEMNAFARASAEEWSGICS